MPGVQLPLRDVLFLPRVSGAAAFVGPLRPAWAGTTPGRSSMVKRVRWADRHAGLGRAGRVLAAKVRVHGAGGGSAATEVVALGGHRHRLGGEHTPWNWGAPTW